MVKLLLRLEGLAIFFSALYFYASNQGNWIAFVLFILLPDISMVGYITNTKIGAVIYNLVHTYILSIFLMFVGLLLQNHILVLSGIILLAHVGMDRFFGYGLKYPTNFTDTHLQKV